MPNNLTDLLTAIQKAQELFPEITKDGDLQQVVKAQITAQFVTPSLPLAKEPIYALPAAEAITAQSLDDYKEADFVFAEDHFKLRYGHAPAQPGNFYKAIKNMFIQEFKQEPFQHKKAINAFRSADAFHYPLDWLDAAFETLQVATPNHWKLS
jgi:hypothetical protein